MGACQTSSATKDVEEPTPLPTLLGPKEPSEQKGGATRFECNEFELELKKRAPMAVGYCQENPQFMTLKHGFNQRFVFEGKVVVVCRSVDDVVGVVDLCRQYGLRPTIGSGYHCYEGFITENDGVIVDVSMMDNIETETDSTTGETIVSVGPGCYNWKLCLHLFKLFGKDLPGGSCYSVCAGGHICGGGYGVNSRLHGLTVDFLHGVEMVVVGKDNEVTAVRATKDSVGAKRELAWAVTGSGGQQFGVITKYFFRLSDLPAAPTMALLTTISIPWSTIQSKGTDGGEIFFKNLLRHYGEYFDTEGRKPNNWNLFTLFPAAHCEKGNLKIVIQATSQASVEGFLARMGFDSDWSSDPMDAINMHNKSTTVRKNSSSVVEGEVRDGGSFINIQCKNGVSCTAYSMPWLWITQILNGSGENQRFKNSGAYHTKPFSDPMLNVLWKFLTVSTKNGTDAPTGKAGEAFVQLGKEFNSPIPLEYIGQVFAFSSALVQMDSYGGAINSKLAPDGKEMPIPRTQCATSQRSSIMKLQPQIYWKSSANDGLNLWWLNTYIKAMYQATGGVPKSNAAEGTDGGYINYPDIGFGRKQEEYAPLYWPSWSNYSRLQKAKAAWDPNDVFNFSQSIRSEPMLPNTLFPPEA